MQEKMRVPREKKGKKEGKAGSRKNEEGEQCGEAKR
jgi:hypothetical protein